MEWNKTTYRLNLTVIGFEVMAASIWAVGLIISSVLISSHDSRGADAAQMWSYSIVEPSHFIVMCALLY